MATRKTSARVQKDSFWFTSVLASAVREWFLMFLLFIEAFFSFLVTRFARFCELQTPCPICSRLDHIIGSERPGFYWDLICHSHKLELSSLVYCCIHENLCDVHRMCEDCISSFSTSKKFHSESERFSLGKLGPFLEYSVDEKHNICLKLASAVDGEDLLSDPLLKDPTLGLLGLRQCSCCNAPLSKKYAQRSLPIQLSASGTTELDVPIGYRHFPCQDGLRKRRKKSSASAMVSYLSNHGFDPLSHVGYTELKITSDSESEVPISDDDDSISLVHGTNDVKLEFVAHSDHPESITVLPEAMPQTLYSELGVEKLIDQAPLSEPLLSVPLDQFNADEPRAASSVTSVVCVGHGLEELNWSQVASSGSHPPAASELIYQDGHSPLSNAEKAPVDVSEEKLDVMATGDVSDVSLVERKEVVKPEDSSASMTLDFEMNPALNEPSATISSSMVLNDAYKLAINNKGSQPLLMGKDPCRGNEDLKLLLSQVSAACGFELQWNDITPSPRVNGHGEEVRISDASISVGPLIIHKRLSMDRNESGLDSLDGILVSETEGECSIEHLKQQLELDQKSLRALYKELEEERSASAISANQAMAMINRLQEEKAAVQMEALQYQRMMEEQAEYDHEALQKSNDLLAEKEKEIQDLEAELETYREGFQAELTGERIVESPRDLNGGVDSHNTHSEVDCHENSTGLLSYSELADGDCKGIEMGVLTDTLLDFDDEKLYILNCLKRLQEKLNLVSDNGVYVNLSGVDGSRAGFPDNKCKDIIQQGLNEEQVLTSVVDDVAANGGHSQKEGFQGTDTEQLNQNEVIQRSRKVHDGWQSNVAAAKTDLVAISNEVSCLNERLRTLESENNFLEHSINTLRNGNEGAMFIREIASHLREFRRFSIRSREQAVA